MGATAAAAVLTIAKEAATAEATSNTTVVGASTAQYGLLASPGTAGNPVTPTLRSTTHGVIGSNASTTVPFSSGVAGVRSGAELAGVLGVNGGDGFGVFGLSTGGFGVVGGSTQAVGIFGLAQQAAGVYGLSTNSTGVFGQASANAGVYGVSPVYGVWGQSTTGWGIYGQGTGTGGIGVYGQGGPKGFAGYFNGNVCVTGQLFVNGVPVSGPSAQSTSTTRSADVQATPAGIEPKDVKPPVAPAPPNVEGPRRERQGGPDDAR
jgi:hypothetical protein